MMGVAAHTYDKAMIESALFRSGGTKLSGYQYGPALPPSMRNPKESGKGVGHVYIHVKGSGDSIVGQNKGRDDRSLFADSNTAINAIVEIMKTQTVLDALARLDQDPQPNDQEWIKNIPVTGPLYGHAREQGDYLRKITTVSINMRSHGDALFISSCYPDSFQAGPTAPIS
jgi:hypothetical protein